MVLESCIEGLVNRFCGRWLSNFSRHNMDINMMEGRVELRDLIINTQELEELCLPLTPRCISIGKVHITIPITVNRPFVVQVCDVVVLGKATTDYSGFYDVRQALQSTIHLLTEMLRSHFIAIASSTSELDQFLLSPSVC